MKFIEKPPSEVCPACGYSREKLDPSSPLIHDKETNGHTPFFYRPWFHFRNWVQYFIDDQKYVIEPEKLDLIYSEIGAAKITNLKDVNWEVVSRILHRLAATKDPSFTDLYPHVYQITNIIRGGPVVTFGEDLKKVVFSLFNPIYAAWEPIKERLNIDRDNFLSNPIILQIIFIFLDFPSEIISMLNLLKGEDNLRMYDQIISEICKALNRDVKINTSMISNMRYGKIKPIMETLQADEKIMMENQNYLLNNPPISQNTSNTTNTINNTNNSTTDSKSIEEKIKNDKKIMDDDMLIVRPKKRKQVIIKPIDIKPTESIPIESKEPSINTINTINNEIPIINDKID